MNRYQSPSWAEYVRKNHLHRFLLGVEKHQILISSSFWELELQACKSGCCEFWTCRWIKQQWFWWNTQDSGAWAREEPNRNISDLGRGQNHSKRYHWLCAAQSAIFCANTFATKYEPFGLVSHIFTILTILKKVVENYKIYFQG